MQKLADISCFESLMNGGSSCQNVVFNGTSIAKKYPKKDRPFREGFRDGWQSFPYILSPNPILPLLAILFKTGLGTASGIHRKIKHGIETRRDLKELEAMVQYLYDSGLDLEAFDSYAELHGDRQAGRMNKDQYLKLLERLFYDNEIYRSSDYDDPDDPGKKPHHYSGPSMADYMGDAGISKPDRDGDDQRSKEGYRIRFI